MTKTTILTARLLGFPVKYYLKKNFNLDVYVVAVGNANPKLKADYIEKEINAMQIIIHRRNTIEELKNTPKKYGVEVDLRTNFDQLIISHDAFKVGQNFEEWLKNYYHNKNHHLHF